MPSLSSLDGASLVPQITEQFQKRISDVFQDAAEKSAIDKLQGAQTQEEEQASLLRLTQLDPALGTAVQGVLERGDKAELDEFQKRADEAFKFSTFIGGIKDFHKQGIEIDKRVAELQSEGGDPARIQNLVKLKNMTPQERELAILKTKTLSSDVKAVSAAEQTRVAKEKTDQQRKFVNNAISADVVRRSPVANQGGMLEQLALQEEQAGNSDGAFVWRQIADLPQGPRRDLALRQVEGLAAQKFTPTKALKAETEIAKLNQDFSGGLITPQQYTESVNAVRAKNKTTLVRNLESAGVDLTTEEGKQLAIDAITKPRTVIKDSAIKLPLGFAPANPTAWEAGDFSDGIVPLKGGRADVTQGEQAGKIQMLRTAKKAAVSVDKLIYQLDDKGNIKLDKEGKPALDRVNLFNAWAETPGTEGRKLAKRMEFGIQAITRLETGAAMPAEELNNTRARFMPTFTDSDETVELKIQMFNDFMGGTLKLIDPTGRFNDERFQVELEGRKKKPKRKKFNPKTGRVE